MSDYFHYYNAITNTSGDSLAGYFARVLNTSTGAAIPLYADDAGTAIITVSGYADLAVTDSAGNLSFYVEPGTYNVDLYAPDATTFIKRIPKVGMTSTQGVAGPAGPPGAAGNVASSLAELKAALTTNDTMIYQKRPYKWFESSDDAADDDIVVASDDSGFWISQKAADLPAADGATVQQNLDHGGSTLSPWAGAVRRTGTDRALDVASAFDTLLPQYHAAFIARTLDPNDYNPAPDIQKAIDAAAAERRKLIIPAGLYPLIPTDTFTAEGGTCARVFAIRSYMQIAAENGATFKIADGVSTDITPKFMAMFATDEQLTTVGWAGLTMDMNGANNPISPNRGDLEYNRFNQAPIFVSGTPDGNAALINGARVLSCTLRNIPGVSGICMAQSNEVDVDLGSDWGVRGCLFENVGTDTDDHSSIYGWADDVVCEGNIFRNPSAYGSIGKIGGNTAYEIHGSRQQFQNNSVLNFLQGVWNAANRSTPAVSNLIANNIFRTVFEGVSFYREIEEEAAVSDTVITGNQFYFDDTVVAAIPELNLKRCVNIAATYTVSRVFVFGNHAYKTGSSVASAFMTVSGGGSGQKHTDIYSANNRGHGFSMGTLTATGASAGLGLISHTDNRWSGLAPAGIHSIAPGDYVDATANPIDTMILGGGSVVGGQYGSYLSGTITSFHMKKIACDGVTVANVNESGLSITDRRGFWEDIAFTPVWTAGSAITLGNGSVQGRYSIDGSIVTVNAQLTVGSTTTFPGGSLILTVPIVSTNAGMQYLGNWRIFDSSASIFKTGVAELDGTGSNIALQVDGAANASNTSPIALATGDVVSVQLTYRAAA